MKTLAEFKALADEWADQDQEAKRTAVLCSHFDGATPGDLIAMLESGRNLKGSH
ncbi:MAG TPA: hypothetical protein VLW88_10050 [Hyphomicrobium sp.]|nr:hypothetical protein [Hyphomicrobium sp.]